MFNIDGKVALVTGGSRGIGKAIAIRLAEHGMDIAVNYVRHKQDAKAVAEEIEKRGQRVAEVQAHRGPPLRQPPRGWDPLPRGPLAGGQVPAGGDVGGAAAGLGEDALRDQEAELDADAGEADALAPGLGRRSQVVVPGQLPPAHPRAVVHHDHRPLPRVRQHPDAPRTRVEGVGHHLGEDRLLELPRVGVAQVLEQVSQIDSCLAQCKRSITRPQAFPGP